MRRSPEVMRAWESDAHKCDGCNLTMRKDEPVLVVNNGQTVCCAACLRWAMPQIEALEEDE